MVKKETLKIPENNHAGNVILFTIASSESDIRLCIIINKVFQINLSLADDLDVKGNNEVLFKKYFYEDDIEDEKFILLPNLHPSGIYLFPELKNIDYIFIISSESKRNKFEAQIKNLKGTPGISAVFKLDPSSLKSFKKIQL